MTAKEAMQDGYTPCTRCLRQYLKTGLVGPHDDDDATAEADEEQGVVLGAAGH
jgi:methylphosphotriester-DNA--protein-cysteine methyltransferase